MERLKRCLKAVRSDQMVQRVRGRIIGLDLSQEASSKGLERGALKEDADG